MKIISLQAENIKKLVAIEITPDSNLVQITGKNGSGKTSCLDSIWWALEGVANIQGNPIRNGANKGRIRLNLGELMITRTFNRKEDGGATTSIVVENADGARFPTPQKMLDELLGELSFDPLAFARAKPKDQFQTLRKFVPTVDFEKIEQEDETDRARRKSLNKLAEQERGAASVIVVPAGTPLELIDESELITALSNAGDENSAIERKLGNRRTLAREIESLRQLATSQKTDANRLREEADELDSRARDNTDFADEKEGQLKGAAPLTLIDTGPIRAQIAQAHAVNANVRKSIERRKHNDRAQQLEEESAELTRQIKKRQQDKMTAIAAAKLPIPGIGFGEDVNANTVMLNGVPFDQASDAQQLTASVMLAMALNPKLKVIRIRDGSLLDDDAMQLLRNICEEWDMQVWIERVDSSGKIGFVFEEGRVRKASES